MILSLELTSPAICFYVHCVLLIKLLIMEPHFSFRTNAEGPLFNHTVLFSEKIEERMKE